MPVKTFRPLTPSTRYISYSDYSDITKSKPEKRLVETRKRTGGRNVYGRMTARGIGGGHKQKNRLVDFKRNKHDTPARIERPAKLTSVVIENSTRPKYSGGPKCSARSATTAG